MRVRSAPSLLLPLLLMACGTARDWREVAVGPTTFANTYQGITRSASADGYLASGPDCDAGLGIYQSRWRHKNLGLGRPGRFRLRAEIQEGGSAEQGWTVRFYIEQQKVKDLGKSMNPGENDWSWDGQDTERERVFGEVLRRNLDMDRRRTQPEGAPGDPPRP